MPTRGIYQQAAKLTPRWLMIGAAGNSLIPMAVVLVCVGLAVHIHQQQMGPEGLIQHRLGQDLRRRSKGDQTPVQTDDLARTSRLSAVVLTPWAFRSGTSRSYSLVSKISKYGA